jgi:hypothetical protein
VICTTHQSPPNTEGDQATTIESIQSTSQVSALLDEILDPVVSPRERPLSLPSVAGYPTGADVTTARVHVIVCEVRRTQIMLAYLGVDRAFESMEG